MRQHLNVALVFLHVLWHRISQSDRPLAVADDLRSNRSCWYWYPVAACKLQALVYDILPCLKAESNRSVSAWKRYWLGVWAARKLQALVYDILPSTSAVFSYATGPRKLSANEQFFVGAQTVVSLLQTTQIKQGVSFIAANKVYTSTNKTTIVWIETESVLFFFTRGGFVACLHACFGARLMMMMMSWCLMSSDVIWHIRDKLWPMPKHGSIKATYVRCMRV